MSVDNLTKEKLEKKINSLLDKQGLELIEMKLFYHSGNFNLRLLVDYSTGGVTLNECLIVNKQLVSFLKKENILGEDFVVEVNSPGIDRKFNSLKEFEKVIGKTVNIWFKEKFNNMVSAESQILNIEKDAVVASIKGKEVKIPINIIKTAKQKVV